MRAGDQTAARRSVGWICESRRNGDQKREYLKSEDGEPEMVVVESEMLPQCMRKTGGVKIPSCM